MCDASILSAADQALLQLLRRLDDEGYDFVTPTPATHARVLARFGGAPGRSWRDILGWSRAFHPRDAPAGCVELLEAAGMLVREADLCRAGVRVSRLDGQLFLHSPYPTEAEDSVFLGPDSYRFAALIHRALPRDIQGRVVDVGGGGGVGALVAARRAPGARLITTDLNRKALRLARLAAAHAGLAVETRETDGLEGVEGDLAAVLANPPYMAASDQAYRDGGDLHGGALSLAWVRAALPKLRPGGRMILYTGSAICEGGRDELGAELTCAAACGAHLAYAEIDPDVFGEELERPAYADVERIACVSAVFTMPRPGPG